MPTPAFCICILRKLSSSFSGCYVFLHMQHENEGLTPHMHPSLIDRFRRYVLLLTMSVSLTYIIREFTELRVSRARWRNSVKRLKMVQNWWTCQRPNLILSPARSSSTSVRWGTVNLSCRHRDKWWQNKLFLLYFCLSVASNTVHNAVVWWII